MTDQKPKGCVQPAAGPIAPKPGPEAAPAAGEAPRKETTVGVMVGKPAPDFEATAFHEGDFKNIKLSEFKGQWVMLCFYPGDFTFV